MEIPYELQKAIINLSHKSATGELFSEDYREICQLTRVSRMYYDINLGEHGRYRDRHTDRLVIAEKERGNSVILYEDGQEAGLKRVYPYYYNGAEFVHACIEFSRDVKEEDIDEELFHYLADIIYNLVNQQNMRKMLDYAEVTDLETGIPNSVAMYGYYRNLIRTVSPDQVDVLYINIQNFNLINELAGSEAGDEVIIRYSRLLMQLIDPGDFVCHIGGDNYVFLIRRENLQPLAARLRDVRVSNLEKAPNRTFSVEAWIGVSELAPGCSRELRTRVEDAGNACRIAKSSNAGLVIYNERIGHMIKRERKIIGIFHSSLRNDEFIPYYQPKVDMCTGELVGFEALCRWVHNGQVYTPDEFLPVLDREGLIHMLDLDIFRKTCEAIKSWKLMGLQPPRISTNFSRRNIFVSDIEKKILDIIRNAGVEARDLEIEITETIRESEFRRLMDFVHELKDAGLHISVDDFGTGYSSLAMIQSIEADEIKIDKSFVTEIPRNKKSRVLVDSITHIANNLEMDIIAEGVETAEQGLKLIQFGCHKAQGFLYSKPVDFNAATEFIRNPHFTVLQKTEEPSDQPSH